MRVRSQRRQSRMSKVEYRSDVRNRSETYCKYKTVYHRCQDKARGTHNHVNFESGRLLCGDFENAIRSATAAPRMHFASKDLNVHILHRAAIDEDSWCLGSVSVVIIHHYTCRLIFVRNTNAWLTPSPETVLENGFCAIKRRTLGSLPLRNSPLLPLRST